jgi:hypothetical protein
LADGDVEPPEEPPAVGEPVGVGVAVGPVVGVPEGAAVGAVVGPDVGWAELGVPLGLLGPVLGVLGVPTVNVCRGFRPIQ